MHDSSFQRLPAQRRLPHDDGDGPLTRPARRYPLAIDSTTDGQTAEKIYVDDNNNNS